MLWNEALCAVGYENPWVLYDYYSIRGIMWVNFVWVVWKDQHFCPIDNPFTHTKRNLSPQNSGHKNYPLRKHDDIMILISVSVCHYPLFLSLSSKKNRSHFCFAAGCIPLLILSFLRYQNCNYDHTSATSQHIHTAGLKCPTITAVCSEWRSLNEHTHQLALITYMMHTNVKIWCLWC